MKIEKNKVAALAYKLEVEGKIADQAGKERPLEYIHGTHMLIPRFEEEVEGKEPGESFEFTLSPEEGYGVYKPEFKFDIPKRAFEMDGTLREDLLFVGNIVPMLDNNGNVIRGMVAAIGEDTVSMDFNHPMAGKTLHFTGEVVSVRDASEKELTEGLHGEYLPPEDEGHHCCHGKGKGHCHKHAEGEGCCHEEGKECDCQSKDSNTEA